MARREILDRIQKYVDPFRITKGKGFRLKGIDPGDTCGLKLGKGEAAELLATRHPVARGRAGHALRAGPLVAAARVSGDGCGRQGRHDQARHVGRQSAGLPGVLIQAALAERTSTTTSCGATSSACPSAGASASSTVRTTRRSSSCACTRKS